MDKRNGQAFIHSQLTDFYNRGKFSSQRRLYLRPGADPVQGLNKKVITYSFNQIPVFPGGKIIFNTFKFIFLFSFSDNYNIINKVIYSEKKTAY